MPSTAAWSAASLSPMPTSRAACQRRGLGDAHELEREVAVGRRSSRGAHRTPGGLRGRSVSAGAQRRRRRPSASVPSSATNQPSCRRDLRRAARPGGRSRPDVERRGRRRRSPTTAVISPRGHDSSWSRTMIQARMNGAAAAASSSQRRIGCASQPLSAAARAVDAPRSGCPGRSRTRAGTGRARAGARRPRRGALPVPGGRSSSRGGAYRVPAVPDLRCAGALTLPFAGVPLHDHAPLVERAEARRLRRPVDRRDRPGPTASRRSRSRRRGPSGCGSATGVVNPFTRGPRGAGPARRRARRTPSGGRFVLGIGVVVERDRRALERGAVREAAHAGARDRRDAAHGARRRARAGRLQARDAAGASRPPIYIAALRGKMLRLGGRARRRHIRELPAALRRPSRWSARSARASARPARRARPTSSAASSASRSRRGGLGARALDVRRLRDRARLRGVLPLARLGRADRPDGRGLARRRPAARARAACPRT